ncbi:MAG: insulinase family protein [Bacteroidales bacterium]|nr:insulinase family protein [Bacteroidales bacterium]
MKKVFIILIIGLFVSSCASQKLDRSQRPQPGPAPMIQLGDFESFELDNGLKVIVVENRKVPVVSFQLTLDIDPVFEGDAKGYVNLAGSLLREGTANRSKQEIDEAIDFIGGTLSTSSRGIFASSLTRHKESLLDLMSDVLLNPTFPESEMERLINQTRSGLATTRNDANAMARNLATVTAYGPDHPYGEITTEESLDNVTQELIISYYEDHFKPNVAYLVVVGDLDAEEARELAEQYFGAWEPGEVPQRSFPTPQPPDGNRVAFANRSGAIQSVVQVTHPVVLTPGHPDAIKVSVMNSILGAMGFSGRLMQNLREDKGYTYGAYSQLSTDRLVGRFTAFTEVRNEVTDSTVTIILDEMRRLIEEPVDEASLRLIQNFLTGNFARSLESPRTIANFALNIKRYDLPEDYYVTYLEKLNAVTVEDIQEVAARYLKPDNAIIVVAGNQDEVPETLKPFSATGTVEFFDPFGRPVEEILLRPAPEGYTAETVINNYIEAIGGKSQLEGIQDISIEMTASTMGMQIQIMQYQKAPHYSLQKMQMGGMTLQQVLFDGEKALMAGQMGRQEFTEGEMFEQIKLQSVMNLELNYADYGITKELLGIEIVKGKDAFKVEVILPSGASSFEYYDVESGFKIQTVTGESLTTYSDYQAVDGMFFAHKIVQEAGPQVLEMVIDSIEINTGLEQDFFNIR